MASGLRTMARKLASWGKPPRGGGPSAGPAADEWMGRQGEGLTFLLRVGKVAGAVVTGAAILRIGYLEWKRSMTNNGSEPENAKIANVKSKLTVGEKEQ